MTQPVVITVHMADTIFTYLAPSTVHLYIWVWGLYLLRLTLYSSFFVVPTSHTQGHHPLFTNKKDYHVGLSNISAQKFGGPKAHKTSIPEGKLKILPRVQTGTLWWRGKLWLSPMIMSLKWDPWPHLLSASAWCFYYGMREYFFFLLLGYVTVEYNYCSTSKWKWRHRCS
jgi:hypothetical protein